MERTRMSLPKTQALVCSGLTNWPTNVVLIVYFTLFVVLEIHIDYNTPLCLETQVANLSTVHHCILCIASDLCSTSHFSPYIQRHSSTSPFFPYRDPCSTPHLSV
ncbi:hypothetical protein XELAEV_18001479mg [Xenopus laevis]|nr:hypothetical protein XELAEV_18001479mg [Xenopus laevis]